MDVRGAVTVDEAGRFAIALDRDTTMTGRIDGHLFSAPGVEPVGVALSPGVHTLDMHLALAERSWTFVPTWNGRSAFDATTLTVAPPRSFERWLAPVVRYGTIALVLTLAVAWIASLVMAHAGSPALLAWTVASAALMALAAGRPIERLAALGLLAAPLVPIERKERNWRAAMLLVGVPWLAFFVARSMAQVGHISAYSVDDWLAYQVAGYRIFLNGFWLEGGSKVFDYQPLYRWLSGALHLVFGDSSAGEMYWDAACLLAGAFVAYTIVGQRAGFRWAVAAAAATLATFAGGTTWYFPGRGLSEIAAAGFAFFAALCLLTKARHSRAAAVGAGVLATLMFYTRLNHLLIGPALVALLLPIDVPASGRRMADAVRRVDRPAALAYILTFTAGVLLFALRTWWYTGVFGVLYGTSLKNNDTGLRLSTIGSPEVWRRIAHSLSALVWMNEPPHVDPRAILVAGGAALSIVALLQLPLVSRLPGAVAIVTLAGCASSLVAHTHNYPGRMSIHLVPFAVAMTATFVASIVAVGDRARGARSVAGGVPA
jgi:hypothetical protein